MRVLILSSSTGGGHDMRARAFQAWAAQLPELEMETHVMRPLDSGPGIYRFGVGLYNWIQRQVPALHHLYFNFLELAAPCRSTRRLLGQKKFCKAVAAIRPDIIVSVHGSLNHAYFELARRTLGEKNVRCITYCGELYSGYGFSRNWVNPRADLLMGAVDETVAAAAALGMPSENTVMGGFWLRPIFYEPRLNETERRVFISEKLRFDPDKFILLLSASSRGANNHLALLNALWAKLPKLQIVVLCGKSPQAEQQVQGWQTENSQALVRQLPYNTNVAKLMQSVLAMVTRPGTGATSEAIVSQCPLILNCLGGTMPQEWITVKYCRAHRIAEILRGAGQLPEIISDWMAHPELLTMIRERMRAACPTMTPPDSLRLVSQLGNFPR